jgi:hypothetical protein
VRKGLLLLVRAALTVLLLFLSLALVQTLLVLPAGVSLSRMAFAVILGFSAGILLFTFGARFLGVYVFGHEFTHWLAAKFFLRKTGAIRVSSTSGSVAVERPNLLIILSPYVVPIYTMLWIGLYGVLLLCFSEPRPWFRSSFHAGVGLTYAFHVVRTAHALSRQQQDLKLYGTAFSLSVILCSNLMLLLLAWGAAGGQSGEAWRVLCQRVGVQWQIVLLGFGWAKAAMRLSQS